MQYKIISSPVGARHCRAQKSVLDSTENRYIYLKMAGLIALRGDAIALRGDTILLRGDTIALRGDAIALRGDTILLRGDTILLRGDAILLRGDAIPLQEMIAQNHALNP